MKGISVLLLAIITLTGCRYEKGPVICVIPAESRLVGEWELESFQRDGQDIQQFLDTLPFNADVFWFSKDKDRSSGIISRSYAIRDALTAERLSSGTWIFEDNNKIFLRITGSTFFRGPLPGLIDNTELWQIIKLSEKKLWMEMNLNGVLYEARFKKLDPYQF